MIDDVHRILTLLERLDERLGFVERRLAQLARANANTPWARYPGNPPTCTSTVVASDCIDDITVHASRPEDRL